MTSLFQILSVDVIGKGLLAATNLLLIRYMEPAEFVNYSIVYALNTLFVQLCSGSLNRVYVVGYSRFDLKRNRSILSLLQVGIVVGASPLLLFFLRADRSIACIAIVWLMIGNLIEFTKSGFQQQMRFRRYSLVEFLRSVFILAGVACLVLFGSSSLRASYVLSICLLGSTATMLLTGVPSIRTPNSEGLRELKAFCATLFRGPYKLLFLYFALNAAFSQADLLVLKLVSSEVDVATYASAFRYYNFLLLLLTALNTILLPLSQQVASEEEIRALRAQHHRLLKITIPFILASMVLAGWIMPMIDNGRYPAAPGVFRILAISSVASLAFSPSLNFVMKFEEFDFLAVVMLISLALGVSLNVLLAPHFGPIGTALSVLISTAVLNVSGYRRALKYWRTPVVVSAPSSI